MKQKSIDLAYYQEQLRLSSASFDKINHEDAIVAIAYKVTQLNGKKFILKISERESDYFREVYFLKYLENKVSVPQIIKLVPPQSGMHGALLLECFPGTLLQTNEMSQTLAYELGCCLGHIHLNRLPGYGDPVEKKLSTSPCESFTNKFEEGLDECKNHLPPHLLEACQNYYHSHLHLLDSVDGPCIVHRDFRPGNLMTYNGKLQGVIDWAGARASFAEEDFCTIEHRDWLKEHKKHLLSGYASIRPIPDYYHLIPFLRLNTAIAVIGFTLKSETWKTSSQPIYQYNRQFLEDLLETSN